jgi:hypothetical protein
MYSVRQATNGRFYLQHPRHPGLAWSHAVAGWVRHTDGEALDTFAVITFNCEDDADEYATEQELYPRRD